MSAATRNVLRNISGIPSAKSYLSHEQSVSRGTLLPMECARTFICIKQGSVCGEFKFDSLRSRNRLNALESANALPSAAHWSSE